MSPRKPAAPLERRARSTTELAALVQRSPSTIRRWLKRDDWPFGPRPPWDADAVAAWAAEHLAPDPGAATKARRAAEQAAQESDPQAQPDVSGSQPAAGLTMREVELRLKVERTRKIEVERLIKEGSVHDVAECREQRLRKVHALKAGLLELGRSLAPDLVRLTDRAAIEAAIERRCRLLLRAFASGWDGQGEIPEASPSASKPKRRKPAKKRSRRKTAKKPAPKKRTKRTRKRTSRKKGSK